MRRLLGASFATLGETTDLALYQGLLVSQATTGSWRTLGLGTIGQWASLCCTVSSISDNDIVIRYMQLINLEVSNETADF